MLIRSSTISCCGLMSCRLATMISAPYWSARFFTRSGEPILVCHDHDAYLTVDDPVDEFQELWAVEVHAATDLLPHLVHVASGCSEVHHRLFLIGQIAFLPGAADTAVDDAFLLRILMLQSQ